MSPGPVMDTFMLLESPGPNIVTVAVPCPRETVSPVTVAPPWAKFTPRNCAFGVGLDCDEATLILVPLAVVPALTVTSEGDPGAPPPPPPPPLLLIPLPPPHAVSKPIEQKMERIKSRTLSTEILLQVTGRIRRLATGLHEPWHDTNVFFKTGL